MPSFDIENIKIEDSWSSKEIAFEDSELIAFFRKNLGVADIAGHPALQYLAYLTISYVPFDPQGFPSKEDYKLISDFEEIDVPNIETGSNSIHVASVLKNGIKDLLFYVTDPDAFIQVVNRNNSRIQSFDLGLEMVSDPNWEIYADLP
ncbi:DUF695 domain-containing protein [Undibacterium cyanobacteriorum]|uniref:DUF695 domain-containing protein n=1 Tax=Undibacterium cyanobacteriorum TaxID=3073561 RepID=A0ABY9RFT1_9BURK|nr:DUF695 domain-containing protein [Undibacterium sp. 20NA77.5]WMW79708.1 DUF695 domain-containing protein [Undibacterium sp. 20NA77.5]